MKSRFLITALAACVAGPAAAQPAPERACLVQRNIYDFHPVAGNRALIVTDLARRRYRLTFLSPCYNLQFKFGLRFKTFGVGTLSCVARGDSVLLRDPVGPGQCIIQGVQYQTPAMDQADAVAAAAKNR